jgi:hypothetical protein
LGLKNASFSPVLLPLILDLFRKIFFVHNVYPIILIHVPGLKAASFECGIAAPPDHALRRGAEAAPLGGG